MSGVELQGTDQLLEMIRGKLASGVMRIENQGLRMAGEIIAQAQRDKVAVSTRDAYHIQDDIKVSNVRRIDGMRTVLIGPGKDTAWRAHFLEFGTEKAGAQPFIYPAFEENKDKIKELLSSEFREGMRK